MAENQLKRIQGLRGGNIASGDYVNRCGVTGILKQMSNVTGGNKRSAEIVPKLNSSYRERKLSLKVPTRSLPNFERETSQAWKMTGRSKDVISKTF